MPLSAGDRLGPYEILEPIGKGGMGEVWKARDTRLNRIVAIKTSNQQFSERFEREARAVAALNHPNICTLHDVGPDYLVMEFVDGISPKGPLPVEEVVRLGRQIASALEAAHERHITHRDLKPGNILLKPDGTIKVLDFGLAKMGGPAAAAASMSPENSPTLTLAATQMGVILGTAAYMAPEQAKGKEVDKRADIWAFGVVLYELSTGQRPFHGDDMSEVLASVLKEHPSYEPLPRELRRLIRKCLEKDPAKRLRDIGDAWDLLDDAAPVVKEVAVPAKRSILAWVSAGVMGVAALGTGYVAWQHSNEAAPQVVKLEFSPPEGQSLQTALGTPAVSPDGRRMAFRTRSNGKDMLWVRDLDSANARMLPGTDDPLAPFWAPDSRQVAFGSGSKLMRIDVTGGPATTIATIPSSFRGGDWNSDGVIVFGVSGNGLYRVSSEGGAATPLLELDPSRGEVEHRAPHFLPDGRHFLYTSRSDDAARSAVLVGDLQSKDKKQVLPSELGAVYVPPQRAEKLGHLLFIQEGTLMAQPFDTDQLKTAGDAVPIAENISVYSNNYGYFAASQNGSLVYATRGTGSQQELVWYDRTGQVAGKVGKPADVEVVRLSPDGKRVAVDRMDPATSKRDIWLMDLVRGTEQRLTFGELNRFPVWSPDGSRIAFTRGDNTTGKIWVRAADGSGGEEVLANAGQRPSDWTRSGEIISETSSASPGTGADLLAWKVSGTAENSKPVALRQTNFNEGRGRVSPDGHWLAYQSNESKRNEIYVTSYPSLNGHWQISVSGGRIPAWNPNGRELFFVSAENKMMAVEIQPGSQFQVGVPKALFDVRLGPDFPDYDVSAQGRFLIATPVDRATTVPMTVVLNWPALLKK